MRTRLASAGFFKLAQGRCGVFFKGTLVMVPIGAVGVLTGENCSHLFHLVKFCELIVHRRMIENGIMSA